MIKITIEDLNSDRKEFKIVAESNGFLRSDWFGVIWAMVEKFGEFDQEDLEVLSRAVECLNSQEDD